MSCEFCKVERDEIYLLNLPCGYLVCYEHIKSITVISSCFMCQEHSLNQKSCSKMKKNRVKLEKIKNLKLKNLVIESCNQVDALKNDHQTDLRSHFSNIINQIDLKRELLKNQFNNLIDDYYMSLVDQVTAMESEFSENTKSKLNEVNTDELRERLNNFTDLDLTEDELTKNNFEILSNLYEDKLKKFFDFYKEFKRIKFCEGSNIIDINTSELFGSINTNLLNTTKSSQLEKTLGEEEILKDCFISFLHSSEDFFVQKSDFDSEIEKIQPVIDQCLEPFDLNESQMCIGQFRQDGMFYRCKILQWMVERREAFCEMVDFGKRDYIDFDTITRMSDSLSSVKPLAINCSLGFGIQADSQAYANLNDLVISDTKFDCKFKSDCANGPALVELFIAKNNLVISKELLKDANCMTMVNQEAKKSLFDGSIDSNVYLNLNSTFNSIVLHPKNHSVIDLDESSWSRNNSVIDNTSMQPKNETVNDVDENSWSRNNSVVDTSSMHPKNETVNDVDENSWSRNNSVIDNTSMQPKNETVNDVDESSWSGNNSIIHNTT